MMTIHQMIVTKTTQTYARYKAKKVTTMTRPTMAREINTNQTNQKKMHTYIRPLWQRELSRSSSGRKNFVKF